ncbi:hypothetical protein [uncultured Nevskia sp.]|uniref:hypothetical protein n=1 Tax=uncultured Nevskia sp. TaxID=228950 RepID=UPI0025FCC32B|nr:hypothetical protein [uncultured Nevskia sp.]
MSKSKTATPKDPHLEPQVWNAEDEGWEPIPTPGSEHGAPPSDPEIREVRKRDTPSNPIGPDHPTPELKDQLPPNFKAKLRKPGLR